MMRLIKKELIFEGKKEYVIGLMNNKELSWIEIGNILNPPTPLIENITSLEARAF